MKLTDNQQRTFLNLALNSGIEVVRWNVLGNNAGIVVRSDSFNLKYPLDVKHWNAYLPPSFELRSSGSTPEYNIRRKIKNHFDNIRKLVTKNDWVECDSTINLNEKETVALFHLTGLGSHYVIVDLPSQADPYVSCHQIIDAAQKSTLKRFRSMVEAELLSRIGKENLQKLFRTDPSQRTMMYLHMCQNQSA